ncbi:translocation/assembly module TamB domain-containing protein [Alistipes indistinctus]|uniref:translocation/assembly module TamB domain-containing protein n=1 Tax=Alistipes indistinctus TaxID=626932 RepID=UPI0026706FCB|nr:hypothetical protein [Alistipes indistinctus]
MAKKIVKYLLRGLLCTLAVLIVLPALLYIPAIQNFIRAKAEDYVSAQTEFNLSVRRIRLAFPLNLVIEQALVSQPGNDTLLYCGRLQADVALLPLLRKQVTVRKFTLSQTTANYLDTAAQFGLRARIGKLILKADDIDLKRRVAGITSVELSQGDVSLSTGESPADTTAKDTATIPWTIQAKRLRLNQINFRMETRPQVTQLAVRLAAGDIADAEIDLGKQEVRVNRILLKQGNYSYLTDTTSQKRTDTETVQDASSNVASQPWTIAVNRIELQNNAAEYGRIDGIPAPGFDPSHIAVSGLNFVADSLYNRGSEIRGRIASLSLRERSGLAVDRLSGSFGMDSSRIFLSDFNVQTPFSSIRIDVQAAASALKLDPASPLQMNLAADIDLKEIMPLTPFRDDPAIRKALNGKTVTLNSNFSGTVGRFSSEIALAIPHHLNLSVNGLLASATDPAKLNGQARIKGVFSRTDFLRELLPDSTLRNRLRIPGHIGLHGRIEMHNGAFAPVLALAVDSGTLTLKGHLTPKSQQYDLTLACDSFPAKDFLPADSLGRITLQLETRGKGFDPLVAKTQSELKLQIDRFDYLGFPYNGIALEAVLKEQNLSGRLTSQNEALQLDLGLQGHLTETIQKAEIRGVVDSCHLDRMHLTRERIGGTLTIDLTASATADKSYTATLALDKIVLWNKWETNTIRPTSLTLLSAPERVEAGIRSGDLQLDFEARVGADSLGARFARGVKLFSEQLRNEDFNMDTISSQLPPFRLQATAGRKNILNNYLKLQGISFKTFSFDALLKDSTPFSARMVVYQLTSGSIRLDTLTFSLRQQRKQLNYLLRLANHPGNLDNVGMIALYGNIAGDRAILNCLQKSRSGEEGFRFGLQGVLSDSTVTVSMFPENPTFGSRQWSVNPDNHIVYHIGKDIHADFLLTHDNQRVSLRTTDHTEHGPLALDIAGIDIGKTLALFPTPPPIDGRFDTHIVLQQDTTGTSLEVGGNVNVTDLQYDKRRVGTIGLGFDYRMEKGSGQQFDAKLSLDSTEVLSARGSYTDTLPERPLELKVELPGLPLTPVNALLTPGMAQLSGALKGKIAATGSFQNLSVDGSLAFAETAVEVGMIGTTFTLSPSPISIDNSLVRFGNFQIIAPNKKPLTIDGQINLRDFRAITADLLLTASDFQVVNVAKSRKSMVYGQAYMDLNTKVKGKLDNLFVRGDVSLLGGTEVNYVMQDSPLEVKQQNQNIVTFVSFNDTTEFEQFDSIRPMKINGLDIQVNVNVNNSVKLGVDLSEDAENRVQLQGGGNLTYTMNQLGDSRFSGKYEVSGGFVRYKPPVISEKSFDIVAGSYVEWSGEMLDPAFNLTAVDKVRTNVTSDGSDSGRPVTFDISINLRNTLSDLAVTFDLSAPEDLTMQNQLSSLTAEQRANQAMSLLIYNTYTGPGTTAKVNSSNPLNTFIAKELNQWAQNNLKGVDLSFGVDTYDQTANGGTQRTDYSYKVSKNLFNNRVRAVIGGKFSTDADPTENLKENLIDDISLEYMVTKRDNMFVKLFRHTDYESILEGEVIETGVGFVIRKKMLKITDLFRFMKNKVQTQAAPRTKTAANE